MALLLAPEVHKEVTKVQKKAGDLAGVGALVEIAKGSEVEIVHLDTKAQKEGEALKGPNKVVEAETGMEKIIVVTKKEVTAMKETESMSSMREEIEVVVQPKEIAKIKTIGINMTDSRRASPFIF